MEGTPLAGSLSVAAFEVDGADEAEVLGERAHSGCFTNCGSCALVSPALVGLLVLACSYRQGAIAVHVWETLEDEAGEGPAYLAAPAAHPELRALFASVTLAIGFITAVASLFVLRGRWGTPVPWSILAQFAARGAAAGALPAACEYAVLFGAFRAPWDLQGVSYIVLILVAFVVGALHEGLKWIALSFRVRVAARGLHIGRWWVEEWCGDCLGGCAPVVDSPEALPVVGAAVGVGFMLQVNAGMIAVFATLLPCAAFDPDPGHSSTTFATTPMTAHCASRWAPIATTSAVWNLQILAALWTVFSLQPFFSCDAGAKAAEAVVAGAHLDQKRLAMRVVGPQALLHGIRNSLILAVAFGLEDAWVGGIPVFFFIIQFTFILVVSSSISRRMDRMCAPLASDDFVPLATPRISGRQPSVWDTSPSRSAGLDETAETVQLTAVEK